MVDVLQGYFKDIGSLSFERILMSARTSYWLCQFSVAFGELNVINASLLKRINRRTYGKQSSLPYYKANLQDPEAIILKAGVRSKNRVRCVFHSDLIEEQVEWALQKIKAIK
ncbi:hypothetical protein CEXT_112761 [Caerostris extrusa]|uniref:Uncharacterized protein n=1 Tax=Caerostris extrusa TaxID=172846 RepID=A0AAV4XDG3_CAEEX|nr:hypothetical protein CEXT_112761 [Caerostris extrusa]